MARRFGKEAIRGLAQARRAFQALPATTREALVDAAEDTAVRVRAGAVSRVPVRYGFLRDHIAHAVSRRTGFARVGVTRGSAMTPGGKRVEPSRYAHLVEFGSVHNDPSGFMIRSLESERTAYLERCRRAGTSIERNIAAIGGRFT